MAARLEALENDFAVQDNFAAGSDDEEFELREDSDGGTSGFSLFQYHAFLTLPSPFFSFSAEEHEVTGSKKKRKKSSTTKVGGGMRKTRGMIAGTTRGPRGFRDWLEEAELDRLPEGDPSYLTAAVGPPKTRSARALCSVCGDRSSYTCTRCGAKFCCIRCYGVHTDTRCLKFMA